MSLTPHPITTLACSILLLLLSAAAGAGKDGAPAASAEGLHSVVRLLGAGAMNHGQDQPLLAGIEITLSPGWKTYWRSPGDGIPPSFDWSGSENLVKAEVLWPAPKRFEDGAGAYIGYEDQIILPVLLFPKNVKEPVSVQLGVEYAICKDICIPSRADLALIIEAGNFSSASRDAIEDQRKLVPRAARPGNACIPQIFSVKVNSEGPSPHLAIEVGFAKESGERDLFVEATEDIYLPLPKADQQLSDTRVLYKIGLKPDGDAQKLRDGALALTAVSDAGSCEYRWQVE